MLTQDPNKKKLYKILLDIVTILAIFTIINLFFSLFKIEIPIVKSINLGILIGLIFFLLMVKFAKLIKKYGWIFLQSLVILGPIISFISSLFYFSSYFDVTKMLQKTSQNIPLEFTIINYISIILSIIGFVSLIIFYFIYYRKYLSGKVSLRELGVKEAENEQKFTQQWQEKEKKQNKIGWIIVIILALIFIGVLLYMQFG